MKHCLYCKSEIKIEHKPLSTHNDEATSKRVVKQYVCQNLSCGQAFVDEETSEKMDELIHKEGKERLVQLSLKKKLEGLSDAELKEWSILSLKINN